MPFRPLTEPQPDIFRPVEKPDSFRPLAPESAHPWLATGARVVAPIIGATVMPEAPFVGAAGATALAEPLIEKYLEQRDINPLEVLAQTGISALPIGRAAPTVTANILKRAVGGGVIGAGSDVALNFARTGALPPAREVAEQAALGAGVGAIGGSVESTILARQAARTAGQQQAIGQLVESETGRVPKVPVAPPVPVLRLSEMGRKQIRQMAEVVSPVSLAPHEATDILMRRKGEMDEALFRAEQTTARAMHDFDRMEPAQNLRFMVDVERGRPVSGQLRQGWIARTVGREPVELDQLSQYYRTRLDNLHQNIAGYKDIAYRANFFPHFWKDQEGFDRWLQTQARRPFEGSRRFLQQRVFDTVAEGIAAGFEPISTNPEVLMRAYEHDVRRFLMAQGVQKDMTEVGLWRWLPQGDSIPQGYAAINDPIARRFFPAGAQHVAGRWVAEENTARLINNYLSRNWIAEVPSLRGVLSAENLLNGLQLGLSGFHATGTAINAAVSRMATSFQRASMGQGIRAIKAAATAPFAPASYLVRGARALRHDPALMHDAFTAGMSLTQRGKYFQNTVWDNFLKNIRSGEYGQALARTPFAVVEGAMRPLFSYAIPRVKIGAFADLAALELERRGSEIASGQISRESVLRSVWANIDNRFGLLNYDNLFWNRAFQTANMLTWRAVGWNLGTIRELGGAVAQDLPKMTKQISRGQMPQLPPKLAYTMGLFTTVGTLGGIYHYLHTGKRPETIQDYFYPQTGETDPQGRQVRVQFPTYVKDVYGWRHHPLQTVLNKMAPLPGILGEIIQNRDFFGDMIVNPEDQLPVQIRQLATYLAGDVRPFTFQQAEKATTPERGVEAIGLGITQAPREAMESPREKYLRSLLAQSTRRMGPRTPEQKAIDDLKYDARKKLSRGDMSGVNDLIAKGILKNRAALARFMRGQGLTAEERILRQLPKAIRAQVLQQEGQP